MVDPVDATTTPMLPVGTRVEVRTGFDGSWSTGFEVADHADGAYVLRRRSDDELLPSPLDATQVRKERKNSMWWY